MCWVSVWPFQSESEIRPPEISLEKNLARRPISPWHPCFNTYKRKCKIRFKSKEKKRFSETIKRNTANTPSNDEMGSLSIRKYASLRTDPISRFLYQFIYPTWEQQQNASHAAKHVQTGVLHTCGLSLLCPLCLPWWRSIVNNRSVWKSAGELVTRSCEQQKSRLPLAGSSRRAS